VKFWLFFCFFYIFFHGQKPRSLVSSLEGVIDFSKICFSFKNGLAYITDQLGYGLLLNLLRYIDGGSFHG